MSKCEHGLTSRECYVCASPKHAALAEPQEPVAWGMRHSDGRIYDCIAPGEHDREPGRYTVPLYTHPAPQRQPTPDLVKVVGWILDAGHLNQELLAQLRAAWEAAHGIGAGE